MAAPEHASDDLLDDLQRVKEARNEAVSPAVRLQRALHPWVAFGIMPLFALANAGVSLKGMTLERGPTQAIALGVLAGLVVGKPLGIFVTSFVCVKLGLCALPRGVQWRGILVVGLVAGIGFTMAIFIGGLAFEAPAELSAAKLGVLSASAVAAIAGLTAGRILLPARPAAGAATTVDEAEKSATL